MVETEKEREIDREREREKENQIVLQSELDVSKRFFRCVIINLKCMSRETQLWIILQNTTCLKNVLDRTFYKSFYVYDK